MLYNYLENLMEDVETSFEENGSYEGWDKLVEKENWIELEDKMHDFMFTDDSVTGNGSGSYTFSTYKAEENLCHNMDLLKQACDEFGCEPKLDNPEWCDVTIRCYLLGEAVSKFVEKLKNEK